MSDSCCVLCVAVLEPILEGDAAKDYLAVHVNATLLRGLSALCKQKPAEPIVRRTAFPINISPILIHFCHHT